MAARDLMDTHDHSLPPDETPGSLHESEECGQRRATLDPSLIVETSVVKGAQGLLTLQCSRQTAGQAQEVWNPGELETRAMIGGLMAAGLLRHLDIRFSSWEAILCG